MSTAESTVVPFPAKASDGAPNNFEKIWGKKVKAHGYAAIPTILIRCQHRLGINSTQFCLLMHLLDLYWSKDRPPFPTKQQLADRIGIKMSSIKPNMKALEKAGLIHREHNKTSAGDWELTPTTSTGSSRRSRPWSLSSLRRSARGWQRESGWRHPRVSDPRNRGKPHGLPPERSYPGRMPRAETVPGFTIAMYGRVGEKSTP